MAKYSGAEPLLFDTLDMGLERGQECSVKVRKSMPGIPP